MNYSPLTAFLFIFVLFEVVTSIRVVRNTTVDDRIAGGDLSNIEDMPWEAFLEIYKEDKVSNCGGSIISEKCILTAASCIAGAREIDITIGTSTLGTGGSTYTSNSFKIHPFYDPDTYELDVGLIYIDKKMVIDGKKTEVIKLANEGDDLKTGSLITISGWGTTSATSDQISDSLMSVEVPIMSKDECSKYVSGVPSRSFCAGYGDNGKGFCLGDNGGPAVSTGTKTQLGIMSINFGCGASRFPGVYTKISDEEVRSFIKNNANV